MPGLEELIKSPTLGVIATLLIACAQYYTISKLGPVKKDVGYLKEHALAQDKDSENQWKEMGKINKQVSHLQGEHDAMCDKKHGNA
jgi:hypothetical protein